MPLVGGGGGSRLRAISWGRERGGGGWKAEGAARSILLCVKRQTDSEQNGISSIYQIPTCTYPTYFYLVLRRSPHTQ